MSIPTTRGRRRSLAVFFAVTLLAVFPGFLKAQPASESPAQRQLRDDRERFQREVDRQRSEAQAREANTRSTLSEIKTSKEIERLRARQAAQPSPVGGLNQKPTQPIPSAPRSPELAATSIQQSDVSPDFAVTFLADGRCVIHRKGRLPEVHTAAEAQAVLKALVDQRSSGTTR